jgi:hypothetical protein
MTLCAGVEPPSRPCRRTPAGLLGGLAVWYLFIAPVLYELNQVLMVGMLVALPVFGFLIGGWSSYAPSRRRRGSPTVGLAAHRRRRPRRLQVVSGHEPILRTMSDREPGPMPPRWMVGLNIALVA